MVRIADCEVRSVVSRYGQEKRVEDAEDAAVGVIVVLLAVFDRCQNSLTSFWVFLGNFVI